MDNLQYKIKVFESFLNTSRIKYTFIEEIGHFKQYYLNSGFQFIIDSKTQCLYKNLNVDYEDAILGNIINFLLKTFDSIEIKNIQK